MKKLKQIYVKRIFSFIVFFTLILAIFVLSRQPAGYRRELENRDRILRDSITLFKARRQAIELEVVRLGVKVDSLTKGLQSAQKASNQWKQRYDQAKRTHAPVIPDRQLDSLIATYR